MAKGKRSERGKGTGDDYDPRLHVMDVPSKGLSHRVLGWLTNRVHHFLSDLEYRFFLVTMWHTAVSDFREQFPLPIEETQAIAEELGVKHPSHPKSKAIVQMTTDAIITVERGQQIRDLARSMKYADALASMRTLEKLEIERRYHEAHGTDWGIVTERDIPTVLAKNVEYIYRAWWLISCAPLTEKEVRRIERTVVPELLKGEMPLRDLTGWCDDQLGFHDGASLRVVRHLIANRRLAVDMSVLIEPTKPLAFLAH